MKKNTKIRKIRAERLRIELYGKNRFFVPPVFFFFTRKHPEQFPSI